ncbi:rhomboid family intramembrane serine protease [Fulvivirga sediminis]|uniref:Rhomboid family intramembrane serine protease n=1 Tax=Fulvivirga sediminis TaxID=2803949 RepID=A0A937F964_9BACT|nr:rhomboid family intramembrane serine protease [Fulvivirga sediminis]MBL3656323.1 rhomboid family intramembrane serine protease [Fulvivirga sediminis]
MYNNGGFLGEFKNAFNRPNYSHVQLIIINVVMFVLIGLLNVIMNLAQTQVELLSYIALPANFDVFITRPWTIMTYMFTHVGIWHILMNMLILYWFGRILINFLGSDKLIASYVLGGLAGGVLYMVAYNFIPYFAQAVDVSILFGASAGVLAVVAAAATLVPNYTVVLMFIGPVKIKYIALFYVVLSFLQSTGSNAGGEIAHLGGALMGFVYIKQIQKGTDLGNWIIRIMYFFKRIFTSSPKIKVSYKRTKTSRKSKAQSSGGSSPVSSKKSDQAEIDAILDKISEKGYDSLSKEEKQKLFNASNN